jgi:hypothetical protein
MASDLFPDLDAERARLAFARRSRDAMIERLESLDPESAADEITKEYIEVTVADALVDLRGPGAGDFFGRIDEWYIGRRHIEDEQHDPVVVDWRAPIAAPFYRATSVDPLGVAFRRRFTLDDGELIAYLDEHLDDPNEGEVAGGIPDPVLAEIGAERSGEMREIVSTIQAEQDIVIRSPIDQILVVQGGPGTGKTAVALHRAAYLLFEHRARLARDGVLVVGPNRAFLDYIANVLPSLGERTVRQATVDELCIPRVEITGVDDVELARWKGDGRRISDIEAAAIATIRPPDADIRVPIGARTHVIERDQFADWLATALSGTSPLNQRRERMRSLARRELLQRTGSDDAWSKAAPAQDGDQQGVAHPEAGATRRPSAPGTFRQATGVDPGRPTPRRRGQLDPQRIAVHLRPCHRRRGAGPLGGGAAGDRPSQPEPFDDARRRRRPVHDTGRAAAVVERVRPPRRRRCQRVDRRPHHRLPGARADPGDRESVAAAHGRRRHGEPERAPLGHTAHLAPLGSRRPGSRGTRTRRLFRRPRARGTKRSRRTVAVVAAGTKRRRRVSGVVAPARLHAAIVEALAAHGVRAVDHVHELDADELPVFDAESVKGLEFDGVIVVNPHEVLSEGTTSRSPSAALVCSTWR